MTQADTNTLSLLLMAGGILLLTLLILKRYGGSRTRATIGGQNQLHQNAPAGGPPPAGAPPHVAPAHTPHHATRTGAVTDWLKGHLWTVTPWTIVILGTLVLLAYSFTNMTWTPTSLFGYGVGLVVLILLGAGAWSHIMGPGNGARYVVTFVIAVAFIIAVGETFFYIGTDILYGPDAEDVRSAVTKIAAEAIDPRTPPAGTAVPQVVNSTNNEWHFPTFVLILLMAVLSGVLLLLGNFGRRK